MNQRRLLERLQALEQQDQGYQPQDFDALAASVKNHLQRLLNAREGCALTVPDFGMPSITDMSGHVGTDAHHALPILLENQLTQRVAQFEPRLRQVTVQYLGRASDTLTLLFKLDGRIDYKDTLRPVIFETLLGTNGALVIQSI